MKLSGSLIQIIHNVCLRKSIFCDMMSEILFKETSLPENFFFNRSLWMNIRLPLVCQILLPSLFSRKNGMNLVKFYWKNFDLLYTELLMSSSIKDYMFRLSMQIVTPKMKFEYLVKKGLLCKILDFVSDSLKKMGLGKGKSISRALNQTKFDEINHFNTIAEQIRDILYFPANGRQYTVEIKSHVETTAIRLVRFLVEFDDMEPITVERRHREDVSDSTEAYLLMCDLHHFITPYVIMILNFDDVANLMIREFLKIFKKDVERITANLSSQQAIEKLLTLHDIEKKPFSIFNFFQRMFLGILSECIVKRTLSDELNK
ncbi:hypothetical protein RF11_14149 [Thelohanellus kitauei]|uniref:Uncharacterized protein n=1 Tax=Thelohanellus kitauei TaxID=669202 RepID=A0A0C2MK40_THEKT|nr:hypothetical protein RF11_14149 [Thelohanellus kitauei]